MMDKKDDLHQLIRGKNDDWYVVPAVYIDTFKAMMTVESDEITKKGYKQLSKWSVDSPSSVYFILPNKIKCAS